MRLDRVEAVAVAWGRWGQGYTGACGRDGWALRPPLGSEFCSTHTPWHAGGCGMGRGGLGCLLGIPTAGLEG